MTNYTLLQFRRGPASLWTADNPVLQDGEPGYEDDTHLLKVGDGSSPWSALPYFAGSGGVGGGGGGSGGSATLAGDSDVTVASIQDGDVLTYNISTSQWVNLARRDQAASGPASTAGHATGAAITIDPPVGVRGYGLYWAVLNANCTVTMPPPIAGQSFVARFDQDSTGGRTLTFSAAPAVTYPGVTIALLTGPNAENYIGFVSDGTKWDAFPITTSGGGSVGNLENMLGDGSTGQVTLDGTATFAWASKTGSVYTLNQDAYFTNLTVNSGVQLILNGWRLFATGTVTNAGTIGNQANNAAGATGGAVTNQNTIGGGQAGANGGTGNGATGAKGMFGTGGTGGIGTAGTAGGGATAFLTSSTIFTAVTHIPYPGLSGSFTYGGTVRAIIGGSGGCAGGGDATNSGGGGGAGGPALFIYCNTWINNGTVQALGGNGATPPAGNCGGGGGGAGGIILVYCLTNQTQGTLTTTGGAGGGLAGTGTAGLVGGAGISAVYTMV